jgi:DNA helicase IV
MVKKTAPCDKAIIMPASSKREFARLKTLPQITASPEQLPLISQNRLGVEVICGAAGSGKTSTALLRLRSLCYFFSAHFERQERQDPVKILVLTFNRTLAGYIRALAEHQIEAGLNVELQIETFGRWAISALGPQNVQQDSARLKLRSLASQMRVLSTDYLLKEVEYLLGRFAPDDLEKYLHLERRGRGPLPRVDQALKRRILDEMVIPYKAWLAENGIMDWNEIALSMSSRIESIGYDIVIIDESQDFSANQLRAVKKHLTQDHTITFVIDTVQRVYARGFTWTEAGFDVRPERSHTLRANHRNTRQIAAFASSILNGINVEDDGVLPNLNAATMNGDIPIVLRGKYSKQLTWVIDYIKQNVDLRNDSIGFLKPKGGDWFDLDRKILTANDIEYVDITREPIWPDGPANVALSTFHSAKGLEFDYVFILGLSDVNTPHAEEALDDQVVILRRLLAIAVARARKAVIIGYKPGEESKLVDYFAPGTYQEFTL